MCRFYVCVFCLFGFVASVSAAPKMELLPFWSASNEQSTQTLDHSDWQRLLTHYLDVRHPSGIHRFDYAAVLPADGRLLLKYLQRLQALDPRQLNKAEQKAYWINFYNALTVSVVLEHYPVASIKKTGQGFFSFGPWDDSLAHVQGHALSLNQIEHGILRPIWRDRRIHYAVNCASLSCPNLQGEVFTATNTELLLERSADSYINHPRGVAFVDGQLLLSSIYEWYKEDFGDNKKALLTHLQRYAKTDLMGKLERYRGEISYHYDWALNAP